MIVGNAQQHADWHNRLLQAAEKELIKFEQQESEFRKRDREERAAELQLPLEQSDFE
ncbi:hypothetical protein [Bradyrhizobium sp. NAS80.1]|uniref:hypothetical protein n=1 Tax=Bradyrhizobium sp. NAS80.1 TaxID=1680159 RepID=UPI00143D7AD3|nr:hypothetical protein [Bradyrhizobium sp. NAS80.1]